MNIEIKYGKEIKNFENKSTVTIGSIGSDFPLDSDYSVKLVYSSKYKNYVLVNSQNSPTVLFNNKQFTKVLVPAHFSITLGQAAVLVVIESSRTASGGSVIVDEPENAEVQTATMVKKAAMQDIFDNEIERNRVAIVKETGSAIEMLKANIASLNVSSFIMNTAMVIMSVVCSFGMTNYLLGLKIDMSKSVLNLTTNYWFLVCMSAIVLAISFILKQAVTSYQEIANSNRYGESNAVQKMIMYIAALFMLVVYVLNLFYYKEIPGLRVASIFISLLFAGGLGTVSVASGYYKYKLKNSSYALMNYEYRKDFESVLKSYRGLIAAYINTMSQNKIDFVKSTLLNNQMKMVVETFIGIITAPFLAYGVSNTLAACFPEAANWVRISGLRFSPIFLVLATFLIIFAFFLFVRGFSIGKQINASEIIKFDGFHDYSTHGVTILGLDTMRTLNKEKRIVLSIACFIIFIEFTMNVSYFITEIGGDLAGMFKSFVTALVPTALLIAETHLLSSTMHKIRNYSELLAQLD